MAFKSAYKFKVGNTVMFVSPVLLSEKNRKGSIGTIQKLFVGRFTMGYQIKWEGRPLNERDIYIEKEIEKVVIKSNRQALGVLTKF